ncbi:hypothetical protein [Streptomyces sp. NPDC056921]|uniref:hypothetical protein n=1 Tax=Streptomyces sp. NPDC056921 TaxID=3345966 RepID=UPI00363B0A41
MITFELYRHQAQHEQDSFSATATRIGCAKSGRLEYGHGLPDLGRAAGRRALKATLAAHPRTLLLDEAQWLSSDQLDYTATSGTPPTPSSQSDADPEDITYADSRAAHGNFRNWARLTAHTLTVLNRTGRPRVDQEVLRWAFSRLGLLRLNSWCRKG